MKNALILHGKDGNPDKNWFSWLQKELIKKGYDVWVPQLPDADDPDIQKYLEFITDSDWKFNKDSVIVGYSAGAVAILGILTALGIQIHKSILVGGFTTGIGLDKLFTIDFDWNKIKNSTDEIHVINSDDDPHIPIEHGVFLAESLGVKHNLMIGQKHFNESMLPKYKEFPELLDIILS